MSAAYMPESLVPMGLEAVGEREAEPVEPSTAAERLASSRERMRQWMRQADGRHEARRRNKAAAAAGQPPAWMDRLRSAPVLGVVIDAVAAWWDQHPLQPVASLAQGIVREALAPMARRHPVTIVLGAFVAGMALVRFKPWRWIIKPALFAGLTTQVLTRVVSSVPIEAVLEAMSSFAQRSERADDAPAQAPADAPSMRETATP